MKRGSRSISKDSLIFKAHCDQLSAMGRPVEDTYKVHWYLRGLGHEFSTFSITQLSLTTIPSFKDIVPKAESFNLFSKSIDYNTGVPAYVANFSPASSNRYGNSNNYQHKYKGGPSKGGNRSKQQYKRPPQCQICREEGHYATDCNRRYIKPCHNPFLGHSQVFFLFFKKKKPARCRFERHCAASSSLRMQSQGRRRFFENVFPAHFLSLPLHKTLSKPIPTQPYPANMTIKERDTMPCKHSRPPYPAEVRQPVPPCTTMGQSRGGTFSSCL